MTVIRDERLRKAIRRLLFVSPELSRAFMSGSFRSVFKGRGMEFDAIREYSPEDDARSIDWNASVRFGRPFVKTWREDRSLSVFIVFDESASMSYGSNGSKAETAAVAASLIAYAAALSSAPVGALFFSDRVTGTFVPSSAPVRAPALAARFESSARAVREGGGQEGRGTVLAEAAEATKRELKRRSLVFFVSDFLAAAEGSGGWSRPFGLLARNHDVVAIRIYDDADALAGRIRASVRVADAETGKITRLTLGRRDSAGDFASYASESRLEWLRALGSSHASRIELRTGDDSAKALVSFFKRRRRAG
ncbi:MAG: DUF58 domain-containing protein [Spirochaetes bacterium]|nr:DUF58 domain-containing protein [Spirochaetota bacterium]